MENVADPKEFGKRGEPLFFGLLLLLALIFFPPAFFKVRMQHCSSAYCATCTGLKLLLTRHFGCSNNWHLRVD